MTTKIYLKDHSLIKEFLIKTLAWSFTENIITIPVFDAEGKRLFNKYRHLSGSVKFNSDKGSHPALYCIHKVKKESHVVFCEGEPDAARLWQEGISAVTGTAGVKTFSKKLAKPLQGKTVTICLDNDEGGQSSVEQYYNILLEAGAKPHIIDLPENYKDVSDYFTGGGTKKSFEKLPIFKTLEEWKDANLPEEFKWETAQEILDKKLPDEKWLVNKVVPVEGFTFFIGPEASAKSFHGLSLTKCVVTGEPWLPEKLNEKGKPLFKVMKKTKVLIMDKESSIRRIQDRLRGFNLRGADIYFLAYPHKFEITSTEAQKNGDGYTEFFKSVSRKVKREGIGLIILDSYVDFFYGDENKSGDTQHFFSAFRQMFPDIAVVVLHHSGKTSMGRPRKTSELSRGSTNIMAQVYTAFHCEPVRKSATEFTIEQTKAGDSQKMGKFKIESQVIDDPLNKNETLVTGFKYIGEVESRAEAKSQAMEKARELLESEEKMFRKEYIEQMNALGIGSRTADGVLKELEEEGLIKRTNSKIPGHSREKEIIWIGEENDSKDIVYEDEVSK